MWIRDVIIIQKNIVTKKNVEGFILDNSFITDKTNNVIDIIVENLKIKMSRVNELEVNGILKKEILLSSVRQLKIKELI